MELIIFLIEWENATGNEESTTKIEKSFPIKPSRGYFREKIRTSYMLIYLTAAILGTSVLNKLLFSILLKW